MTVQAIESCNEAYNLYGTTERLNSALKRVEVLKERGNVCKNQNVV